MFLQKLLFFFCKRTDDQKNMEYKIINNSLFKSYYYHSEC